MNTRKNYTQQNHELLQPIKLKKNENEQFWERYELAMIEILKKKINDSQISFNRINLLDLSKVKILATHSAPNHYAVDGYKLHPLRYCGDVYELIEKYTSLISLGGFIKEFPIVFDREGNLLDGYQRLHACRITCKPFTYVILDITTPQLEKIMIEQDVWDNHFMPFRPEC